MQKPISDQEHAARVINHNLVLNNALRFAAHDYLAATGMMHIGEVHIQKQKKLWIKQVQDALTLGAQTNPDSKNFESRQPSD